MCENNITAGIDLQERGNVIPKVPVSLELPLGEAAFKNALCRPYWKKPVVAIVGNGPLTAAQQDRIEEASVIIRCIHDIFMVQSPGISEPFHTTSPESGERYV